MKYTIMMFSPTGGTEKVAAALTSGWGIPERTVDLTNAKMNFSDVMFSTDEAVVIAVPSYGGRVPGLAAKRIRQVNGNGAIAILVCAYGNRAYEDTLVELEDLAQESGFQVKAAVAAVAEHSIVRRFGAERPDAEDKAVLEKFGKKIQERIQDGGKNGPIPGNRPYKKTNSGMVPQTSDTCVQCGLCAGQCPAGAIDLENPKKIDATKCISCMRCVAICPKHAKALEAAKLAGIEAMLEKVCSVRKTCELY